jgi:hypothetical protein
VATVPSYLCAGGLTCDVTQFGLEWPSTTTGGLAGGLATWHLGGLKSLGFVKYLSTRASSDESMAIDARDDRPSGRGLRGSGPRSSVRAREDADFATTATNGLFPDLNAGLYAHSMNSMKEVFAFNSTMSYHN